MIVFAPQDSAEVNLFTQVLVVQHGAYTDDDVEGYAYWLETGVISEVVEGMKRQLGEEPTPPQALRAVLYYIEHDAFPDLSVVR